MEKPRCKFKKGDWVVVVSPDAEKDGLTVGQTFAIKEVDEFFSHEDGWFIYHGLDLVKNFRRGSLTMSGYLEFVTKLHKVLE